MNLHRNVLHLKLTNQRENFGMKGVGAGDANRQAAVQAARDAPGFLQRSVAQRQDLTGVLIEGFSRLGQLHAPRQAPEQRCAHFLLKPFNLLAQWRL